MLDISVMNEKELEEFKGEIRLMGVVDENYSDLHSFSRGTLYGHQVTFSNGKTYGVEGDGYSDFTNMVMSGYNLTTIIIPFKV